MYYHDKCLRFGRFMLFYIINVKSTINILMENDNQPLHVSLDINMFHEWLSINCLMSKAVKINHKL